MTVHERGATVLFGRCDEEALRPYQPFAEALSTYLRVLPGDELQYRLGRSAVELGRLVPELTDSVPGLVDTAWSDAESQRFRLFEAVATLLAELAASAPALLVVDDLHWADNATLLLVRHLARHADAGKLVILGTYREENARLSSPFGDMLVTLDRAHVVTHVDVGGLDDAEVADLLEGSTTASRGAMLELARRLRDETEGNPFFICQMLGRLGDNGEMLDAEGQQVAGGELGRLGVPSGVRGLVAQRVARLADPAERVLTAASVVGREFTFDVVGAVTDADEERVLDVLEEAVHAGLVREVPSRVGAYMFSHALVRQTLYEGLTAARRGDCTVVWVTRSRRSTSAAPIRRSPSLRTTTSRRRLSARPRRPLSTRRRQATGQRSCSHTRTPVATTRWRSVCSMPRPSPMLLVASSSFVPSARRRGVPAMSRVPARSSWRLRSSPGSSVTRSGSRERRWASVVRVSAPGGPSRGSSTSSWSSSSRARSRGFRATIRCCASSCSACCRSSSTSLGTTSGNRNSPASRSRWHDASPSQSRSYALCARGGSPDGTSQTCMSVSRCATRRQKSLVTSTNASS